MQIRKLLDGKVTRLNPDAGFGYVTDEDGENAYIFRLGDAIEQRKAAKLAVGRSVKFRLSSDGRVDLVEVG